MPTYKTPRVDATVTGRKHSYAVLTGDIVSSSRLTTAGPSFVAKTLRRASTEVRGFVGMDMPLSVDIFRGDSWQVLLSKPHLALRAALLFRAALRSSSPSIDTRLAIGIGSVDRRVIERVSEGQGEAFSLSGRMLEVIVKSPRMRFNCVDPERRRTWDAMVGLIDYIIVTQWTPSRSRAMTGALRSWRQDQTTTLWGGGDIAQSSVSELLSKAGWGAVKTALDAFEAEWQDAE